MDQKILVIEDEPALADILRERLQRHGFHARAEYDGRSGLEAMLQWRPDLALANIQVPGICGDELVMIRNSQPALASIPIFLCSGYTFPEDIAYGLEIGADDYITKPYDWDALLEKIRKRIGKSGADIAVPQDRTGVLPPHRLVRRTMRHCNALLTRDERDVLKLLASRRGVSLEKLLRDELGRVLTKLEARSPKEVSLLSMPGVSRKVAVSCSTYLEPELDLRFWEVAVALGTKRQAIWRVAILSLLERVAR